MKTDTHPAYFDKAQVRCACGNTFTVGSTMEAIEVEICRACHPFYTGNDKLLDTAGRVEKFKARTAAAKAIAEKKATASPKKAAIAKATKAASKKSAKRQK